MQCRIYKCVAVYHSSPILFHSFLLNSVAFVDTVFLCLVYLYSYAYNMLEIYPGVVKCLARLLALVSLSCKPRDLRKHLLDIKYASYFSL